jgi:hypothetical protein
MDRYEETRMKTMTVAAIITFGSITASAAQPAVAIVEDVKGKVSGVEFMDYVAPGKVIKLGTDGVVVLGYMTSCWRETIKGGVAVVGVEGSRTSLSEVSREKVSCDARRAQLSEQEATQGAATTFRSMGSRKQGSQQQIQVIYGMSPVIEMMRPGKLVIERMDIPGQRIEKDVSAKMLVRGKFFDLAPTGELLLPGGTYRVSNESRSALFSIDPGAQWGPGPLVGRLVRL